LFRCDLLSGGWKDPVYDMNNPEAYMVDPLQVSKPQQRDSWFSRRSRRDASRNSNGNDRVGDDSFRDEEEATTKRRASQNSQLS
jgi:hypothetical protein